MINTNITLRVTTLMIFLELQLKSSLTEKGACGSFLVKEYEFWSWLLNIFNQLLLSTRMVTQFIQLQGLRWKRLNDLNRSPLSKSYVLLMLLAFGEITKRWKRVHLLGSIPNSLFLPIACIWNPLFYIEFFFPYCFYWKVVVWFRNLNNKYWAHMQ